MKTYKAMDVLQTEPTVCALGCFDGVHMGHQAIIGEAQRVAKHLSLPTAVWSFSQPPRNYFADSKVPLLTLPAEKQLIMRRLGVDIYVSIPFSADIASMSAIDFFEKILLYHMKARHIVCGFNYRFGKGGEGNTELLSELCQKHGIGLSVMPPVKLDGHTVSSTLIREALALGDIHKANAYLGRPYFLRQTVIDGKHLGRTLGFPTINQSFPKGKAIPKNGVYVSAVTFNKKKYFGITNTGTRPTVGGQVLCAETNIFDFCGELYGKAVTVEFLEFLRPEQRFESVEALSIQVHRDIAAAKKYIENTKS